MPQINQILVITGTAYYKSHHHLLQQAAPGADFVYADKQDVTPEMLRDAQVILGTPSLKQLQQTKNLQWLQLCTAGADYYCAQPDALPHNMLLTNATGAFGLGISEYMIGTLLMMMRKLHFYRDNQANAIWQRDPGVRSISGSTVLTVGLGDIGGQFARKTKALGAYTIGIRRNLSEKPDWLDELHPMDQLDPLLPRCDVVALSLPATDHTRGLFGSDRLHLIRKGGYLINVGRGSAVDTQALCQVLESGHLAGAALDVTDPEPLLPEHPLWKQQNAIITPHCSGNYDLPHTVEQVLEITTENLRRFAQDKPLRNLVSLTDGYRMFTHAE